MHEQAPRIAVAQVDLLHVLIELALGEEVAAIGVLFRQQHHLRQRGGVRNTRHFGQRARQCFRRQPLAVFGVGGARQHVIATHAFVGAE